MDERILGFFSSNVINDGLGFAEGRVRNVLREAGHQTDSIGRVVDAVANHVLAYNELYAASKILVEKLEQELADETTHGLQEFEDDDPKGDFTKYFPSRRTGREAFEVERLFGLLLSEAVVLGERVSTMTPMLVDEFPGIWGITAVPTGRGAKKNIRALLVNAYGKKIDELRTLEDWRDKYVHARPWYVGAIGMPWELWFADEYMWPEWVIEVGERFSMTEVRTNAMAVKDFAEWWIITAEVQTGTLPDHLWEQIRGTDMDLPPIARRS